MPSSSSYPASKQTFPEAVGTQLQNNPDHALYHGTIQATLGSLQDTVGTTLGTNALKDFTAGQFPVRMNASSNGTVNGSIVVNNGTMGTPTIVGTFIGTGVLGTASLASNVALVPKVGGQITAGAIVLQVLALAQIAISANADNSGSSAWPTPFSTLLSSWAIIKSNSANNSSFVNGIDGSSATYGRVIVHNSGAGTTGVTCDVFGLGIL